MQIFADYSILLTGSALGRSGNLTILRFSMMLREGAATRPMERERAP